MLNSNGSCNIFVWGLMIRCLQITTASDEEWRWDPYSFISSKSQNGTSASPTRSTISTELSPPLLATPTATPVNNSRRGSIPFDLYTSTCTVSMASPEVEFLTTFPQQSNGHVVETLPCPQAYPPVRPLFVPLQRAPLPTHTARSVEEYAELLPGSTYDTFFIFF